MTYYQEYFDHENLVRSAKLIFKVENISLKPVNIPAQLAQYKYEAYIVFFILIFKRSQKFIIFTNIC